MTTSHREVFYPTSELSFFARRLRGRVKNWRKSIKEASILKIQTCAMIKMKSNWFNEAMAALIILRWRMFGRLFTRLFSRLLLWTEKLYRKRLFPRCWRCSYWSQSLQRSRCRGAGNRLLKSPTMLQGEQLICSSKFLPCVFTNFKMRL